jgi:hypothetical protein
MQFDLTLDIAVPSIWNVVIFNRKGILICKKSQSRYRFAPNPRGEHWNAMQLYLDCAVTENVDDFVGQIRASDVQDRDAPRTAVQWPSWNMMEGPKSRTDDPGTQLGMWTVRFISTNYRATILAVLQIYIVFNHLLQSSPEAPAAAKRVEDVFTHPGSTL